MRGRSARSRRVVRQQALELARQIVGDQRFFDFARAIQREFRHGNLSTAELIEFAKGLSGFGGPKREMLDQYFEQWLYGEVQPTILPENFD